MKKTKISILLCLIMILQLFFPVLNVYSLEISKEQMVKNMTTEEKIAQLLMPTFRIYDGQNVTTLNEKLESIIAKRGFAGIILFAENNSSTEQTVKLIDEMQRANIKNTSRPQLLIAVDQEGAGVSRLAEGTQGPGNMALGASGDSKNAYTYGEIAGGELSAIGYNVDFAPVVDVNSNPSNPVIGVRSFSDDPQIVSEFGIEFIKGLKGKNIITSLKHFPGHGDTSTDSHTGLPRVEKSYDELKKTELVPFANAIKNGAEMIMTAHIQFPKIETETYTSIKDESKIELPATLSKKIITDILRKDLGFDGVVVTDAMNMKAISDHFNKLDSAKLALNAGVDIILMPVNVQNDNDVDELDKYISDVAAMVDNGEISIDNVNKAVLRVLTLKENNNLLSEYNVTDIQSKATSAKSIVGSKTNHDKEWEIARKSITLVKNDNNMLPISSGKTVILVQYANEVLSGEYAIKKLREDGIISDDMDVSVFLTRGKDLSEIKNAVKDAKNVIFVSEQYSEAGLSGASYQTIDAVIAYVHEQGNKIAFVSSYLPYDVARLQESDALLLAYSAKGMNELPDFNSGTVKAFGVSIPCGIYTAFDRNAHLGKLPVNIPTLDSNNKYTSSYLYERGYGLQYNLKYKFVGGENQTIDVAKFSQLAFEFDIAYDLFAKDGKVYIDDVLVDSSNYLLSSNTIITFSGDYLKTLSVGEHTLKLVVYNGEIETKFNVTKSESSSSSTVKSTTTEASTVTTKTDVENTTDTKTIKEDDKKTPSKTTKDKEDKKDETTDLREGNVIFIWVVIITILVLGTVGIVVLLKKSKKVSD